MPILLPTRRRMRALQRRGTGSRPCRGLTLALLLAAGAPAAHALVVRHNANLVTVATDERINDTLVALGDSIAIDGTVNGDVVAAGRRVVVHGTINGDLIAAAESISVEGTVRGNVIGFGGSVDTTDALIGRNMYGFGRDVTTTLNAEIDGNATVFAAAARLGGTIGADATGFARRIELSADVKRNVDAFAERVTLLDSARIAGDLNAHLSDANRLEIAPGAKIAGHTRTHVRPPLLRGNRYARGSFYLVQLLRFAAAFVAGLVLFALFPALRSVAFGSAADLLKSGAAGLVALVSTPILAALAMATIIGLPVGAAVLLAWLLALYLAKIVLAGAIGRRLLGPGRAARRAAPALAAGLLAVIVLITLPYAGAPLNLVLTVLGLGLLTQRLWSHLSRRPPPA
jgi:cytoskeletal protein CcmA (bactofilin family)